MKRPYFEGPIDMKCSLCNRQFKAHVLSKPYCQYHYQKVKEDIKNKLTYELILLISKVIEADPKLASKLPVKLLEDISELLPRKYLPKSSKTQTNQQTEARLEAEIRDLKQQLNEVKDILPLLKGLKNLKK